MSESVIVEILDSNDKPCAPGEIGRVVVTDLHNLASPITGSPVDAVPSDHGKIGKTQTAGSTGEPVIVRKTGISQLFLHAHTLRNHAWHQIPFSARYTSIRANDTECQEHANWGAPFVFLYETGPSQLIPIMTPLDRQNELRGSSSTNC